MRRGLMVALCAMALTTSAKTLVFHLDFNTVHLNRETIERTLEHVAKSGYTLAWSRFRFFRRLGMPNMSWETTSTGIYGKTTTAKTPIARQSLRPVG